MHTEAATVVDRLRQSRSLPWLRVLDDAELDWPAEPDEPDDAPEDVVEPYRWLLERVGDGVRLTQAGYLPSALVTETMTTLGWADDWIGKQNREDQTLPVLELRESAQRFGLLRKNRGQLLVTKVGKCSTTRSDCGGTSPRDCRMRGRNRSGTPECYISSPSPPAEPWTTRCSPRA